MSGLFDKNNSKLVRKIKNFNLTFQKKKEAKNHPKKSENSLNLGDSGHHVSAAPAAADAALRLWRQKRTE